MRKTDLTDRRPMETLHVRDITAIMTHATEELEKAHKPGEMPLEAAYVQMVCDAYNAGFHAGMRAERRAERRKK